MPRSIPKPTNITRLDQLTLPQIRSYLDSYPAALARKSSHPSSYKPPDETLEELDEWYRSCPHPTTDSPRSPPQSGIVELEDLIRLMHWKLAREKYRPRLIDLISSNPSRHIHDLWWAAEVILVMNDEVPHWGDREGRTDAEMYRQAMDSLGKLKGVGPATASAIVATWTDVGIFQSDELVEVLMGKVKIEYTWPFYWRFYKEATAMLEKLKKKSKGLVKSGKEMERLAWSMYHSRTAEAGGEEEQVEVGAEEEQQAADEEEQVEDEVQEQEQVPIAVAQEEVTPAEVTPKKGGRKRKAVSTDSPTQASANKKGKGKQKAIAIDLSGEQEDDVQPEAVQEPVRGGATQDQSKRKRDIEEALAIIHSLVDKHVKDLEDREDIFIACSQIRRSV